MKPSRKPARRSLDDALKIIEAGIEKIVAEIRKSSEHEAKPSRPRSRSKALPPRAA